MFGLSKKQGSIKEAIGNLFSKNKFEKQLLEYQKLSEEHPQDARVWLKIAETNFRARHIEKAVQAYEKVALLYEADNFYLKAISIYKNILKLNPASVEASLKLADLYHKVGSTTEMITQYRIAMHFFEVNGDKENLVLATKKLVEVAPSASSRRKLAEVCQNAGLMNEALAQYEILARDFRQKKQYDDLLRVSEMILPHKPKNHSLIRDICILYLRRQEPDHAIRLMERYHVDAEPDFSGLMEKAKLMREVLRKEGKAQKVKKL